MENLKNQINQILQEIVQPNGLQLYNLQTEFHTSQGDESGTDIYCWVANPPTDEDELDQFYNSDQELGKRITESINPEGYKRTRDEGLTQEWRTDAEDFIKLHYSDACIHLICFQSGQY